MALNVNATIDMGEIEQAQGFLAAYRYARDRIGAILLASLDSIDTIDECAVVIEGSDD